MNASNGAKRDAWLVQQHALEVLARLVRACDREGIDVLPVKGVLSARTLYEDVAERVITDVDVRVRPRDVARLERLAGREGWRVLTRLRSNDNLVLSIDGLAIDVEGHVGPPGLCTTTVDELIHRASRESSTLGFSALVADPHDHALLLVLNVFKDHLAQALSWAVTDLNRLVRSPGFEERELVGRARSGRVETALWLVAEWMARFMGDARWAELRERMGPPPRGGYASTHLWLESIGARGGLPLRLLARFGCDSPRAWRGAAVRLLAWKAETWWLSGGENAWSRGERPPAGVLEQPSR